MSFNVITLGQTKSDNINRITTISDDLYLVIYIKWDFTLHDHIKRLITLTSDYIKRLLLY